MPMLVIWSGYGIVVPIVLMIVLATAQCITDSIMGIGFYSANPLPKIIAAIAVALVLKRLGYWLNERYDELSIDTNWRDYLRHYDVDHSFFFVPVEYCGHVCVFIVLILVVVDCL